MWVSSSKEENFSPPPSPRRLHLLPSSSLFILKRSKLPIPFSKPCDPQAKEFVSKFESKVLFTSFQREILEEAGYSIHYKMVMVRAFKIKASERKEYLEQVAQTHLVVATLITTMTFTAAITMPGGFVGTGGDPHYEGSAILRRNAVFKVFIITDAISLVLSSSAVVIHLLIPLLFKHTTGADQNGANETIKIRTTFLNLALNFTLMAMGTMMLAFITGAYAVLAHSLDLAITTCVIGSCFFVIIFVICVMYRKDLGLSDEPDHLSNPQGCFIM